tara:strand:+ start:4524 stop:4847 length:324 start_codon:yes stop_codon:yes gene_type:complete
MFNKGMGNLYKQAQKMQKNINKVQDELKAMEVEGSAGGEMVKVVVNGKKDVLSISINQEILNEDKEMIEDVVLAAIKKAMENADKVADEKMKSVTGGMMPNMNIPGF